MSSRNIFFCHDSLDLEDVIDPFYRLILPSVSGSITLSARLAPIHRIQSVQRPLCFKFRAHDFFTPDYRIKPATSRALILPSVQRTQQVKVRGIVVAE